MTTSILFTGVGGQGTILTSKILSIGLVEKGYDVKMSEIHGMSQRGGTVNTQIKYGDKVYAPNIGEGEADIVVAFEKVEALRALPFLKKGGKIVMDDREIFSMPVLTGAADYPHDAVEALRSAVGNIIVLPASRIAEELGNIRAQNICLLGALIAVLGLRDIEWEKIISENVPPKMLEINLKAFRAGCAASLEGSAG